MNDIQISVKKLSKRNEFYENITTKSYPTRQTYFDQPMKKQLNAFKWNSKSKCSVITHSKSWKGNIFKDIFSMNVSKMYKICQKAQSIVALKRVEHNPHVLLCNK